MGRGTWDTIQGLSRQVLELKSLIPHPEQDLWYQQPLTAPFRTVEELETAGRGSLSWW